jgi:hypothetical protein
MVIFRQTDVIVEPERTADLFLKELSDALAADPPNIPW